MRLASKVALVTGPASGFGAGIARRFAEEGAPLVAVDLNLEGAQAVCSDIAAGGGEAVAVRADVSRRQDIAAAIGQATERYGRLDILVNNAGWSHVNKSMLEVTEEEFDRAFAVNVKAIYLAALEAVPIFRSQGGGCIINISSTAGLRPRPGLTWYNASKGAVNVATQSMAVELAPDRIRVNALCPVIGETGMTATFLGQDTPEQREKFIATIPLGRMSQPRDIANAALYLASDEAEFITGVLLEVDGGRCV